MLMHLLKALGNTYT